jgi:NADPH:quinone reductase-like Zn-dependent oxidoreductase
MNCGIISKWLMHEYPVISIHYEGLSKGRSRFEITGGGVNCVIDGIGKSTVDISIDSLARRGIFISFGDASVAVIAFHVLRLIGKSAHVTRHTSQTIGLTKGHRGFNLPS